MNSERERTVGPHGLFELRRTRNHTVIVLVSIVDRRIVPALHVVSRLGSNDSRALHVADDPDQTRRLAADWMNLGLSWLPLHIEEAVAGDVAASVRHVIEQEAALTDRLTVVVPELDLLGWWHPLVHRGRARRIAHQLQPVPGVTSVIVPFYVPPSEATADRLTRPSGRSSFLAARTRHRRAHPAGRRWRRGWPVWCWSGDPHV